VCHCMLHCGVGHSLFKEVQQGLEKGIMERSQGGCESSTPSTMYRIFHPARVCPSGTSPGPPDPASNYFPSMPESPLSHVPFSRSADGICMYGSFGSHLRWCAGSVGDASSLFLLRSVRCCASLCVPFRVLSESCDENEEEGTEEVLSSGRSH